MTNPQQASAKVRLPVPTVAAKRLPQTPSPVYTQPTAAVIDNPGTKYCSDPDHRSAADCAAAAARRTEPMNGPQNCALVATRNGVLAFRKLMRWDDPDYTSAQPPGEALTAGDIWQKFDKLMTGCVDHIVEHLPESDIDNILGVYVDFADPLRASLALAVRLFLADKRRGVDEDPEHARQLRRQLADDPVLKYVFDQLAGRH